MMPVRNRADFLAPAMRSVLAQTERDFELVVVDDGSTDDSLRVAQRIAAEDERVVVLRNPVSRGIPVARNQVIAVARGRYLAICDSDDLSRPGRFAAQMRMLDADPGLVGVGVRIEAFSGDRPGDGVEPDWHWGLLDGRLPFAFCGAMLRLAEVRDVGGYDEGYPVAEDLQLAYRMAGAGARFGVVDEVLVDYRLHPGSTTNEFVRKRQWYVLRAQLRGLRELGGRLSPRGYAVIGQSGLRLTAALLPGRPGTGDPGTQ